MQNANEIGFPNRVRFFGFSLFVSVYFLSFVQRVGISVIANELTVELGLDTVTLGFLSSGFLISYAIAQPAIGYLCDKVGPDRVGTVALIIAAIGSFMFASAKGFSVAFLGRILMGAGLAAGFIPGMRTIASMFPPKQLSTYTALFITIGNIGTLVGAAPLAWLTATAGWRPIFTILAILAVLLVFACHIFSKQQSTGELPSPSPASNPASYRTVIKNPGLWLIALFLFTKYGSQAAFQGLWAIPYISDVYDVGPILAAQTGTMIAVGYLIAGPFIGRFTDDMIHRGKNPFDARKWLLMVTSLLYFITWIPLVLIPGVIPFGGMYGALFVMGISASSASLAFSMANSLFPPKVAGLALGVINIMSILGGAVLTPLIGWLIKHLELRGLGGAGLYSRALIPCLIAAGLSTLFVIMMKKPSEERGY